MSHSYTPGKRQKTDLSGGIPPENVRKPTFSGGIEMGHCREKC